MHSFTNTTMYDYIFLWGWISTFACILYMLKEQSNCNKKILILERDSTIIEKNLSFWSAEFPDVLEWLSYRSWSKSRVVDNGSWKWWVIRTIPYRSIRASDFIHFVEEKIKKSWFFVEKIIDNVTTIEDWAEFGVVTCTSKSVFYWKIIFNSIISLAPSASSQYDFFQCFVGYELSTKKKSFDHSTATTMEFFDYSWQISFVYTLPTSSNDALVEYTYFSKDAPISFSMIENKLVDYLDSFWTYTVIKKEQWVIPMRKHTPRRAVHIVDIWTAWWATKPSSWYTFLSILSHAQAICSTFTNKKSLPLPYSKRHRWYDMIMLEVMSTYPEKYHTLIVKLFKHTPEHALVHFLNEKSSFREELQVIWSLPKRIFIRSLFRYYAKKLCK